MKFLISLLLAVTFSINFLCSQTTLVLQPGPEEGKDAVVNSYYPISNLGIHKGFRSDSWTSGGVWFVERSFIEFDLSAIPESAIVVEAKLSLYSYYDDPWNETHSTLQGTNESRLQRIITEWGEFEITWNNQPAVTNVNQVFLPESNYATEDYLDIDVTGLILDMINDPENSFGFRISLKYEYNYRRLAFASSDHHYQNLHPKLVIIYFDQPIADFTFSRVNFTVNFINHSTDATDFLWDFGDGTTSEEEHPSHEYEEEGEYEVKLIASNPFGTDTAIQIVNICEYPIADFTCQINDFEVTYTNTSLVADSYLWSFGDGYSSTLENPVHVYEEEGEYEVKLIAVNDCSSDTTFKTIHICILPVTGFDYSQNGFEVSFINSSSNFSECHWDFGDGYGTSVLNPVYNYSEEGEYLVALVSFNECGSDTLSQVIDILVYPVAIFDYMINMFDVAFINNSYNSESYTWYFGDGETSGAFEPTFTYEDLGIYPVMLIAHNEFGNDSITRVIDITDINNITKNETILIYPNPSEDILYIDFTSKFNGKVKYIITDANGRVVLQDYMNTSGTEKLFKINISGLKRGIYIMNLMHDGYYQTRKIIVQ